VRLIDHVELAGRSAQDLDSLQAIRPLAEDDVTPVHVDEVEPHARALRHHLGPRRARRAGYGRGHEPEVEGAVIGEQEEALLLVVDRVLDVRPARLDQHRLGLGLVAAQIARLARDLARAGYEDVALALRKLDAELEALV